MGRRADLDRLYDLFAELRDRVGGYRRLKRCDGYMDWPDRGVYVFFAAGETRDGSDRPRITRIGTHAVSAGSSTSLWDRLKQHYGTGNGSDRHPHGGNHRGSVYRKRVGEALIERHGLQSEYPDWHDRLSALDADRETVRSAEYALERWVSAYIRDQPFLWVAVDDEPGPDSQRAFLERNVIALVSNYRGVAVDSRRGDWLGRHSRNGKIRASGLWNVDHVEESYDPAFLDDLADAVAETTPP